MQRCINLRWYCPKYSLTATTSSCSGFMPGKTKSLSTFEGMDSFEFPNSETISALISWHASKNIAAVSGCCASRSAASASSNAPAATYKIKALHVLVPIAVSDKGNHETNFGGNYKNDLTSKCYAHRGGHDWPTLATPCRITSEAYTIRHISTIDTIPCFHRKAGASITSVEDLWCSITNSLQGNTIPVHVGL